MDDSGDEDCTIYIEELKSDDPALKLNAVSKITAIAQVLGTNRVCNELVPYLIEIIDEQDNEEEFLIKLAGEISNLKDFVGDKKQVLIAPLELLSSMEEPVVREKSVECLINLSQGQSQEFFETNLFQTLQQLGAWDNYPSRISACSLISVVYQQVWELYQSLTGDDTPMVRRACSDILGQMSFILNDEARKQELVDIWQKLMDDKIDSVKIRAAESSVNMIKLIKDKSKIEEYIKNFFKIVELKQKNWRVRYVVGEMFPQLVNSLSKDIIKNYGVNAYEQLLKDTEPEVRSIGVQTLYSLLSNLPSSQLGQFVQMLQAISTDSSLHVRMSLADQLCKISSVYSIENIINQMIPITQQLFQDEILEIKCKLVHNLPQLAQVLGSENTKKHIMGMIQQLQNEKQWRFRLEVITIIPKLLKITGIDQLSQLSEIMSALNHYQAIRDQALANYIELKEIFGYDKIKSHMVSVVKLLAEQNNYVYRVSALHAFNKFKTTFSQNDLSQIFQEITKQLVNDSVPNVRLNCFKVYSQIKDKLNQNVRNEIAQLAKQKQNDTDPDVQYFATNYNII